MSTDLLSPAPTACLDFARPEPFLGESFLENSLFAHELIQLKPTQQESIQQKSIRKSNQGTTGLP